MGITFSWPSAKDRSGLIPFWSQGKNCNMALLSFIFLNEVCHVLTYILSFFCIYLHSLQIIQMIMGVGVTLASFYYYIFDEDADEPCKIRKENNVAAFLMYGSYLFLFVQFFVGRYVQIEKKSRKLIWTHSLAICQEWHFSCYVSFLVRKCQFSVW